MTTSGAEAREQAKSLKRTGVVLIVLAVLLAALFAVYLVGSFRGAAWQKESYRFVGFASAGDTELAMAVNAFSLESTDSAWGALNARRYYAGLSDDEKMVYRAFETALENGWEDVYLDISLVENCFYSPGEILMFLALDSPLLEQNIRYTEGRHFTRFVSAGSEPFSFGMTAEGLMITVDNFDPERRAKKEEALQRAIQITDGWKSSGTEAERAERVFSFLTDNVWYSDKNAFDDSDYLYDALCLGETNCDGFANAYTLLARLSGLDVFEKDRLPENGDEGHTWNCVLIDGAWYNVDVTFGAGYLEKTSSEVRDPKSLDERGKCERLLTLYASFGFPDSRSRYAHSFEELIPRCTESLIVPDLVLESEANLPYDTLIVSVVEQIEKPCYLIVTNFMLDQKDLRQIAGSIGTFQCASLFPQDNVFCYAISRV